VATTIDVYVCDILHYNLDRRYVCFNHVKLLRVIGT
jgi:hypothetical protein